MNLICYLSNGYPTIESSKKVAQEYVEAGCDIIEIDFPSHNPFFESELIAGRMKKALENCSDYSAYMKGMVESKEAGGDGAFVGSTILKLHDEPEKMKETIRKFKEKC